VLKWIHIGFIVTSLACFFVAVLCAALYLFESYKLKSKHLGKIFFDLPSLAGLDRVHFVTCGWGGFFSREPL
jgi:ABC-type uncharacterized transport system permease subunit